MQSTYLKSILTIAALVGSLLPSLSSRAEPILSDGSAQVLGSLTVYPDSNDPSFYYYMPDSVAFSRENGSAPPNFSLLIRKHPSESKEWNGLLNFTTVIHNSEEHAVAIDDFLSKNPGKHLVVFIVKNSTIHFENPNDQNFVPDKLFKEHSSAQQNCLLGSECGFSADLTAYGALAIKKAVLSPKGSFIHYCYTVSGLALNPGTNAENPIEREFCVPLITSDVIPYKDQLIQTSD